MSSIPHSNTKSSNDDENTSKLQQQNAQTSTPPTKQKTHSKTQSQNDIICDDQGNSEKPTTLSRVSSVMNGIPTPVNMNTINTETDIATNSNDEYSDTHTTSNHDCNPGARPGARRAPGGIRGRPPSMRVCLPALGKTEGPIVSEGAKSTQPTTIRHQLFRIYIYYIYI